MFHVQISQFIEHKILWAVPKTIYCEKLFGMGWVGIGAIHGRGYYLQGGEYTLWLKH